jgi:hypothetical protein
VRSTGRIPKEIPILLIGSDLDGRVFSEHTKTVLLSLHGAGILSRHKLSPEQELVLRWPERNKEAEIRVVGHIGTDPRGHTYGVAFFNPNLNFWEIDFPPISPLEREMGLLSLACSSCKTVEKIDDSSFEADICATSDGVIRFCRRCGTSTLWKPVAGAPSLASAPAPTSTAQLPLFSSPPPPALAAAPENSSTPQLNSNPPSFSSPLQPPPPPAPKSSPSFYAGSQDLPDIIASSPAQSTAVLTMAPPEKPGAPRVNRRKYPRVKVNYSACVRHPERGDDIVVCEDMSKGGLRFKSRKRYYPQSLIDVAVPYEHGQPAIFVPAMIVYVAELPEQQLYRYGVQFLKPTKSRDSF